MTERRLTREERDMLRRRFRLDEADPYDHHVPVAKGQLIALLDAADEAADLRVEVERLTADNIELGQQVARVKGISGQLQAARAEVDAMKGDLTVQMMQRHEAEDERNAARADAHVWRTAAEGWMTKAAQVESIADRAARADELAAVVAAVEAKVNEWERIWGPHWARVARTVLAPKLRAILSGNATGPLRARDARVWDEGWSARSEYDERRDVPLSWPDLNPYRAARIVQGNPEEEA